MVFDVLRESAPSVHNTELYTAGRQYLRPETIGAVALENEFPWQAFALCAETDPEAFFPEEGGSTREAKKICAACDTRVECLQYALDNDEHFGVWGGMSGRERRKLKQRVA